MGNVGPNAGIAKYGNSFSSLRSTRRKRRLKSLDRGSSFVYFIEDEDGMIKIGYARQPMIRLRVLQSGNAKELKLILWASGDSVAEERLHGAFDDCRGAGEWFRPEPALRAYIAELKAAVDWWEFG